MPPNWIHVLMQKKKPTDEFLVYLPFSWDEERAMSTFSPVGSWSSNGMRMCDCVCWRGGGGGGGGSWTE